MSGSVKLATEIVFKVHERPPVASCERGDGLGSRGVPEHQVTLVPDEAVAIALSHLDGGSGS